MGTVPPSLPNLVVVPTARGPLIVPPRTDDGSRDELDISLDELFGPPTQQKPGPLDAALVVGGVACVAFALVAYHGGVLVWIGLCLLGLGLVLPLRSLWIASVRAWRTDRLAGTLKLGQPLNLTDATTRRLAQAYARLETVIGGDPGGGDALDAAHQALQEVATLLAGRTPQGAAEREYVAARAAAVESLIHDVERIGPDPAHAAAVEALKGFEERTGMSSLDRIAQVRAANNSQRS